MQSALGPAVRDSGALLRSEARARAPGTKLLNSIRSEPIQGGLGVLVGSVARTAVQIEEGRKPGEGPALKHIEAWVKRKGIVTGTGPGKRKRTRTVREQERKTAWLIAQSIRRQGTKPLPFMLPALTGRMADVQRLFVDAMNAALGKVARAK